MVYTAVFTNIVNKYTVTWKDEDGNYIAPVYPSPSDYADDEEFKTAVDEYYASLYPTTNVPDASQGWTYVPCAGGGGGGSNLYWSKF